MANQERPDELLSAEVVLRDATGRTAPPITSANLDRHRPDPAQVARARKWFDDKGFTTGEPAGISFSVTGPRALFEETFEVELGDDHRPGVDVLELPVPAAAANAVESVTFAAPPDFGPTSY
ncbi:hypothetical protein JNUCC0626_06095 [Lentzea sp. JNUCC 0626]|uniref:hypothetical protein n=1 Tax=Lentzea sp. JNUCC 0626 TaxID=3367513 RepID=UPI0037490F9F